MKSPSVNNSSGEPVRSKSHLRLNSRTIKDLEEDQQDMIRGIVELSDTTVKEIMVPRPDTVFLSADTPAQEILDRMISSGHSRFPVYEDTIDNIIGILHVKDTLRALTGLDHFDIKALVRKPIFVPESKHIGELLRELKRKRIHVAVVVDEYGGVAGIVCMEDIIEEIVGDIQDEFDNETDDVISLGNNIWLCDARVNLDDLAEETGLELPVDDFDTLGGYVFDLFGKIPVKHEKISVKGIDYIVQDMDGHKIKAVKISVNG
ncbi:MAG: hemolysin family protein [Treponema sp.]|nr:hemolysin family protein [Treponema sp.]